MISEEFAELYPGGLLPMEQSKVDRDIAGALIRLFQGDADRIQSWLESPNSYLNEVQPAVWWRGGKAVELLGYLLAQLEKYPSGV